MAMPRSRKAGTQRPAGGDALHPLERGGRRAAPPTARRRRRSTSAGRSSRRRTRRVDPQTAGGRGGVDGHDLPCRAARRQRPAAPGRRISMATPVEVSLWVRAYRSTSSTALGSGWVPGADSMTWGSSRWGAASAAGRELGRELAERQVLAAPLDEAEGGDVPEARGARRCRARPRSRRGARTARAARRAAGPPPTSPGPGGGSCRGTRRPRARPARPPARGAPSTDRCRSARRTASGRRGCGCRGASVGGVRHVCKHGSHGDPVRRRPARRRPSTALDRHAPEPGRASRPGWRRCRRRPRWPSTPRPRRCAPTGPTSSGSGPASRTSPRPPTSSRRPWPPATTPSTTTTPPPPGSPPCARPSRPRPRATRATR